MDRSLEFMAEAEVTLRLALWLLDTEPGEHADCAIDGAHVRIKAHQQNGRAVEERVVFDIKEFLLTAECRQLVPSADWRGTYQRGAKTLTIKSSIGLDVTVKSGTTTIAAECKGGPLKATKGKSVAAVFASAIGQAVTCSAELQPERLLIAVPDSPAFERVGNQIIHGAVFQQTGIEIVLVGRATVRVLKGR